MSEEKLTEEERALLKQYQSLSKSIPSLVNRLAVEIVPPIVFIGLWLYTGEALYLVVLIAIMVLYNVQRVLRQYKNIVKLNSISKKTIGEADEKEKT